MADQDNAQIGAGTTLAFWDTGASPVAYTALGPIRNIQGVGADRPEVDSTTLDSTAVERIAGLPDGKEVTITFTTGPSNGILDDIRAFVAAAAALDLKLVLASPVSETLFFSFLPLGFDLGNIAPNDLIEVTMRGRITGDISATDPHA